MDFSFIIVGVLFFLRVLNWIIIARILMSWFAPHANGPIAQFLTETSESVLRPLRKFIPSMGMIDWTPLIAIIGIDLLQYGIIRIFG